MITNLKRAGIFALVGFFAGVAVIPFQLDMIQGMAGRVGAELPPVFVMALAAGLQIAVLSFVFGFLGSLLSKKVHLKLAAPFDKTWTLLAIFGGMAGMGLIVLLDVFVFLPTLPQMQDVDVVWWKGLLGGLLYGGIFEEIALRWFLMSLMIWLLAKLTRADQPTNGHYWAGIVLSTVLFSLGHLPATAAAFGELTPLLAARGLISNGLMGLWFGYLFWKKGLTYSCLAHMSSHVFLYGIVKGLL